MTFPYSPTQLNGEIQLLLTEVALLADTVVGDGAGLRMLGLPPGHEFGKSCHPDDLTDLERFALFDHVSRVEHYVRKQLWDDRLGHDITALRLALERAFSPAVLAQYEVEQQSDTSPTEALEPGEPGAGEISLSTFYGGILVHLVELAGARLKVDQDERLTIAEIALLTNMRDATVTTNAYRKNFATHEENGKRYAEVVDVLPWLQKNGYVPTSRIADHDTQESPTPSATVADYVFVPVAKDGSWFSPECASGGRFTIGEKGSEQKFNAYYEALEALHRMPTPRWRRPNAKKIPGIVTGVRFDRVPRADIDGALAAPSLTA